MTRAIVHIAIVVTNYDEAIDFYTRVLGFELIEDTPIPEENKRWVLVGPEGGHGTALLLAEPRDNHQASYIGNQAGGRVFLFLSTDNFERDYQRLLAANVKFVRPPTDHDYGRVAVFEDLYGNLWDLIQHAEGHRYHQSPD